MSADNCNLTLLGVPMAFKSGADTARIQKAIDLVEKRYEDQMQRSRGGQGKDVLLTFMALGLADELLQLYKQREEEHQCLQSLLSKIEEAK